MKRYIHFFAAATAALFLASCTGRDADYFTSFLLEKRISAAEIGAADIDGEDPGLTLSFSLVDGEDGDLQKLVRDLLYGGGSPEEYAGNIVQEWEKRYRDMIVVSGSRIPDWNYEELHQFADSGSFGVIWKEVYLFEGGAHGNNTMEAYVIGGIGTQPRRLEIGDIITQPGSLDSLIDRELRLFSETSSGESLPPGVPLSNGIFFEDAIPPIGDFYPEIQGLVFQWDPYEAAPYSEGDIRITLDWDELELLLSPLGKKLANVDWQQ
jgi:hypothetical protein